MILLRAQFIAPLDRPPIENGAILIRDGRILAVDSHPHLADAAAGSAVRDLGEMVVLPGLVNAHTHLELSTCRREATLNTSFTGWIETLAGRIRAGAPALYAQGIDAGVAQCLKFGVTCVGDISQASHLTRPLLKNGPLRVVSYGEALGLARRRSRFDELLQQALREDCKSEWLNVGLTPHAPYTVDQPGYAQCLQIARARNLPLATHLAETLDETAFLRHQSGPFRELWESLGQWEQPVSTFPASPVRFAAAIGLLDYPTLLAHVNYCDEEELNLLARGRASVVYCPRTHQYFGHPPHRFRDMLAAGVNLALGTDSCASSPDLNLVDEARLLRRLAPDLPAEALWTLITVNAAQAVQQAHELGSITPGKRADLVAFPVLGPDPLQAILESTCLPADVWINGRSVYSSS